VPARIESAFSIHTIETMGVSLRELSRNLEGTAKAYKFSQMKSLFLHSLGEDSIETPDSTVGDSHAPIVARIAEAIDSLKF
jgi:hypothetical protein